MLRVLWPEPQQAQLVSVQPKKQKYPLLHLPIIAPPLYRSFFSPTGIIGFASFRDLSKSLYVPQMDVVLSFIFLFGLEGRQFRLQKVYLIYQFVDMTQQRS